jgi:antitoxin (DNA-binding transcriptional repressor) of toxin-antitoxin stability system
MTLLEPTVRQECRSPVVRSRRLSLRARNRNRDSAFVSIHADGWDSRIVKRVARGERITITERGRPVAVLVPVDVPSSALLQAMIGCTMARWEGASHLDQRGRRGFAAGRP